VKHVTSVNGGHERMVREARAAARLDHASAVRVYDVVDDGDEPWLVMEVLSGRTLSEAINADGPLEERRVAEIGLSLLNALTAAHGAGILHRDVKPSNVQLCDDGRIVLTDFGIAHVVGDASITQTGDIVGSPAFMSPERARGAALGPPSDLFSLGATLYTAVEGVPPFEGDSPIATLTSVVTDQPAPYRRARLLAPVLDVLLAKEPDSRPDPDSVRAALLRVSAGEPAGPPGEPPVQHTQVLGRINASPEAQVDDARPLPPPGPPARARRGLVVACVVAVVLGSGIGVLVAARHSSSHGSIGAGPYSPGQGPVPANWTVHTSADRWSIAAPPSWEQQDLGSGDLRLRRTSGYYGYIAVLDQAGDGSPDTTIRDFETDFAHAHDGYHRIAITPTTFRGDPATLWHFTYIDGGSNLEASELAVAMTTTSGPTIYVLWWQTKPQDWTRSQRLRSKLLAGFRPAP
jgi:serine/threonine protein kinase